MKQYLFHTAIIWNEWEIHTDTYVYTLYREREGGCNAPDLYNGYLMKVSFYGAFVFNSEWNMRVTQKHKADKGYLYEPESIFLMPHTSTPPSALSTTDISHLWIQFQNPRLSVLTHALLINAYIHNFDHKKTINSLLAGRSFLDPL